MKNLKIALAAFLVIAAAVAFKVPSNSQKIFDGSFTYSFTGSTFAMGTSNNTPITTENNWTSESTPTCSGSGKLCAFTATYTGDAIPAIVLADLIGAIKDKYVANGNTFSDNATFDVTINGVVVHFTVLLKA
jgi:hypothetical protein